VLTQQNAVSIKSKDLLPIDFCHLVIINLYPSSMESMVTSRQPQEVSSILQSEIQSNPSGKLPKVLMSLILQHYNLASTTVTGIPMKEEQNTSSSANYDVEIFHEARSHSVFLGSELVLPRSIKEGFEYETVTLKWCTPLELLRCNIASFRTASHLLIIHSLNTSRSVLEDSPSISEGVGGKIVNYR
jgi:Cell cycle and development regulator